MTRYLCQLVTTVARTVARRHATIAIAVGTSTVAALVLANCGGSGKRENDPISQPTRTTVAETTSQPSTTLGGVLTTQPTPRSTSVPMPETAITTDALPPHQDSNPYTFRAEISPDAGSPGTVVSIVARACGRSNNVTVTFNDADPSIPSSLKNLPFEWIGDDLHSRYVIAPDDAKGRAIINVVCPVKTAAGSFVVL